MHLSIRLVLALLILPFVVSLASCSSGAATPSQPPAAPVATIVEPLIAQSLMPGMAVGANYGGKSLTQAFGNAEISPPVPITVASAFYAASVTKQFTAALILRLDERGALSINDRVNKYIPEYRYGNVMTIRNVLNMVSGIPGAEHPNAILGAGPITPHQIIANLNAAGLFARPGTTFDYANAGYTLLAMIAERASGTTYARALQDEIAVRLGLAGTYVSDGRPNPNIVRTYVHVRPADPFLLCSEPDPSIIVGSGDIITTVGDMLKWDSALRSHVVLNAAHFTTMTMPTGIRVTGIPDEPDASYAMGWFVHTGGLIEHGGDFNTVSNINALFPDGTSVVLLTNGRTAQQLYDRMDVATQIQNVFGSSPYPRPSMVSPPPVGGPLRACPPPESG